MRCLQSLAPGRAGRWVFSACPQGFVPRAGAPSFLCHAVHEAGPAGDDSHRPHAGFTCGARPRLGRDECLTGHLWASGLSASPATLPVPHERFPLSLEAPTGLEV